MITNAFSIYFFFIASYINSNNTPTTIIHKTLSSNYVGPVAQSV